MQTKKEPKKIDKDLQASKFRDKKENRTITWLHFSDLHLCNPKSGWEADYILEKLREDLLQLQEKNGLIPDLIFFTGDAVFGHLGESGGKAITEQFKEAANLFEQIRGVFMKATPIENVFIVPGNHDVKRTKLDKFLYSGLEQSLQGDYNVVEKQLSQLIHDAEADWQGLMNRLSDYQQFLKGNGYAHLLQDPNDAKRFIYAVERQINDIKVGIAGLNSAWSCYQDKEKGKLWLAGHWQIQTLYKKLKSTEIRIALMHHPFNWFNQVEDPKVKQEMENHFHFFLHGHEHQGWVTQTEGFGRIGAGASYGDSESETGYNFVRLYLDEGRGKVWLRRYDRRGEGWVPQIIYGKTINEGVWPLEHLNKMGDTVDSKRPLSTEREEEGILDWIDKMKRAADEITKLRQQFEKNGKSWSQKVDSVIRRFNRSGKNPRQIQNVIRQIASNTIKFAQGTENNTSEVDIQWQSLYQASRPFFSFQSDDLKRWVEMSEETDSYPEQINEVAAIIEDFNVQIDRMKKHLTSLCSSLHQLPGGIDKSLTRAIRKTEQAFQHRQDILDRMKNDTSDLLQLSRNLPAKLAQYG